MSNPCCDRSLGGYIGRAEQALRDSLVLPPGYTYQRVGQYQFLRQAQERMMLIAPLTIVGLFLLLYLGLRAVRSGRRRMADSATAGS